MLQESSPLVSIVIPVYNGAKYIEETIRSVLAQTVKEIEVLVMNDASKDNSASIVEKLELEDKRVKLVNKSNSGVANTRNEGIELARGKYIALLDQDDVWEPTNLEEKISCIQSEKRHWAFSDIKYIDAGGQLIDKEEKIISGDFYRNLLKWENVIPAPSGNLVIERAFLGKDIRYDVNIPYPSDRDMVVQLARKEEPVFVNKKLWRYRIHGESMSAVNKRITIEMAIMYEKYKREGFFPDRKNRRESLSRVYFMIAGISLRFTKEWMKGIKFLFKSFFASPGYFARNVFKRLV